MATFANQTFSHASYALSRPTYPPLLFSKILYYHHGPRNLLIDLGCGHGAAMRELSRSFTKAIGVDPSPGMLEQARALSVEFGNVEFTQGIAESLPFLRDGSVDMVTAAQSIHWADQSALFRELKRVVRPGGSLAFWGYGHHVFVDFPAATKVMERYVSGDEERYLGPYWTQPGSSIVQGNLRGIHVPEAEWEDVRREEYVPGVKGVGSGHGEVLMNAEMTVGQVLGYMRTWSAVHRWQEAHSEEKSRISGGKGDVMDFMLDEMVVEEPAWEGGKGLEERTLKVEFATGLILARKR